VFDLLKVDIETDILKCLPIRNITVHPMESLYTASTLLLKHQLHRLPLLETFEHSDNIISVLTQSKILRFIAANEMNQELLKSKMRDLKIGVYANLVTAKKDTPIVDILRLFISKRISSIPIVDDNGITQSNIDVVLNVYEKYDVLVKLF
jgi:CBS-domain-containing membrane protein